MITREGLKSEWTKLVAPLAIIFAGLALVIYSVPGQGKNMENAIGLTLVIIGIIWVNLARRKLLK